MQSNHCEVFTTCAFLWKTVGIVIKVYIENNEKLAAVCASSEFDVHVIGLQGHLLISGKVVKSAATCAAGVSWSKSLSLVPIQ